MFKYKFKDGKTGSAIITEGKTIFPSGGFFYSREELNLEELPDIELVVDKKVKSKKK